MSTDALLTATILRKGYRVAERQNLDKVLDEIKFQASGLTPITARQIAELLNVDSIILAYPGEDGHLGVTCRLIHLGSAEVLYSSNNCTWQFPDRGYSP